MCYKNEVDLQKTKVLAGNPVIVITTVDEKGTNNVAAIASYFRIGSTIILAINRDSHTYKNIVKTGEFVANLPGLKDLESIMKVSRPYSGESDEISASGLKSEASLMVKPPTIREYPASVECRLKWTKDVETYDLVAAEMLCARCDETYIDPAGHFDQVKAGVLHIIRYPDPVYIVADHYVQGIERMDA